MKKIPLIQQLNYLFNADNKNNLCDQYENLGKDENRKDYHMFKHLLCGKVSSVKVYKFVKHNGRCSNESCRQIRVKNTLKIRYGSETYNNTKKRNETNMEKYGGIAPISHPSIIEKIKSTKLQRYGSETYNNENKRKETCRRLYGVDHISQHPETRKKIETTSIEKYGTHSPSQNAQIKEKIEATHLKKYGFKSSLQNAQVKEKIDKTNMEKYGTTIPVKSDKVKEITKKTNLERYGVKCSLQNNIVKEKIKQTMNDRYGVNYSAQNEVIKQKQIKTKQAHLLDGTIQPSTKSGRGKKIKLIGFPHIYRSSWDALYQIHNKLDLYESIKIPYFDLNNKKRIYIPDFVNHTHKKLIELKPDYKLNPEIEPLNSFKFKAAQDWCKQNGYEFVILGNKWHDSIDKKVLIEHTEL